MKEHGGEDREAVVWKQIGPCVKAIGAVPSAQGRICIQVYVSNPWESVRDHAKIRMFTRTIVIVIMGNVRVGTLSFKRNHALCNTTRINHVKEAMGGA